MASKTNPPDRRASLPWSYQNGDGASKLPDPETVKKMKKASDEKWGARGKKNSTTTYLLAGKVLKTVSK